MIKAGIYKEDSFNQTQFCYDICPPDYIHIWRENSDGSIDHWWDQEISPKKFHWLVGEWNNGHIKKIYPHYWENVDTRKKHINSLLQLSHEELMEVFDYFGYVLPWHRWTTELHLEDNVRPLWNRGQIIRYVKGVSMEEAKQHNQNERSQHKYSGNLYLYGWTDSEYIAEALK